MANFICILILICSFNLNAVVDGETVYQEGDVKPFLLLMKKVRHNISKGVRSRITRKKFNLLKIYFPNKTWRQQVPFPKLNTLLTEVNAQIVTLELLKTQFDGDLTYGEDQGVSHDEDAVKPQLLNLNPDEQDQHPHYNASDDVVEIPVLLSNEGEEGQASYHNSEDSDEMDNSENDPEGNSINFDQYIEVCDQLNQLQAAKRVIEARLKKMNERIDRKMTLEFLLRRFQKHRNPRFNTSSDDARERVKALLRDIYAIE